MRTSVWIVSDTADLVLSTSLPPAVKFSSLHPRRLDKSFIPPFTQQSSKWLLLDPVSVGVAWDPGMYKAASNDMEARTHGARRRMSKQGGPLLGETRGRLWRFSITSLTSDSRSGLNRGHPTTVIPKAVRPSHKKGVKS